jgi:hypothetical protein
VATRSGGQWTYSTINFLPTGGGEQIDLSYEGPPLSPNPRRTVKSERPPFQFIDRYLPLWIPDRPLPRIRLHDCRESP